MLLRPKVLFHLPEPNNDSFCGNQHYFVILIYGFDTDDITGLLGNLVALHAFTATVLW